MKQSLLALCLFSITSIHTKTVQEHRAARITKKLFGASGTRSKHGHTQIIEQLIHNILLAPSSYLVAIGKRTMYFMQLEKKELKKLATQDPSNRPAYTHELWIVEKQFYALQNIVDTFYSKCLLHEKIWLAFMQLLPRFIKKLFFHKATSFIEQTAHDFDFYTQFEREHIFIDYTKTLYLFNGYHKHALPLFLQLWPEDKQIALLNHIKKLDHTVKIQSEAGLAEIALDAAEASEESAAEEEIILSEEAGLALAQETEQEEELLLANTFDPQSVKQELKEAIQESITTQETEELLDNESLEELKQETKQTSTERRAERQAKRLKQQIALAEQEAQLLESSETSALKKQWIKTKQFARAVGAKTGISKGLNLIEDYITAPLNNAYKNYVYDSFIAPIENNPLKHGLDAMDEKVRGLIDLSLQMGVMQSQGIVSSWKSKEDQLVYLNYQKQQKHLQSILHSLQTLVQKQIAQKFKLALAQTATLLDAFKKQEKALQAINDKRLVQSALIAHAVPQLLVIDNQQTFMQEDEQFLLSTLSTPGQVWHNIFQKGYWKFKQQTQTFLQQEAIAIAGTTSKEKATNALRNSIFTPYFKPQAPSYTIQIQCSVHSTHDEYFFGILFNTSRWISGVQEQFYRHRCAGVYSINQKTYAFAEEAKRSTNQEQAAGKPRIQWPLYTLFQHPEQYLVENKRITLPQSKIITLTITITPQEKAVIVFASSDKQTPVTLTLPFIEQDFYFDGIGLVAAGCSVEYKIIQPHSLIRPESVTQARGNS